MNEDTYSVQKSKSLSDKASLHARLKIYRLLESVIPLNLLESVIDVGVTTDYKQDSSNFFEKLFPCPEKITAFSNQDASWLEKQYKGLTFVKGDALSMPFKDNSFDLVFSSAVIEHVGNYSNQKQLITECVRISKKYIFITTPNRWHPVEFHTVLPFLHWLPCNIYRAILKGIGKEFFSHEENLNLLEKRDLLKITQDINLLNSSISIKSISFAGFPSNLLLIIEK